MYIYIYIYIYILYGHQGDLVQELPQSDCGDNRECKFFHDYTCIIPILLR